jgi:hypothetical protein
MIDEANTLHMERRRLLPASYPFPDDNEDTFGGRRVMSPVSPSSAFIPQLAVRAHVIMSLFYRAWSLSRVSEFASQFADVESKLPEYRGILGFIHQRLDDRGGVSNDINGLSMIMTELLFQMYRVHGTPKMGAPGDPSGAPQGFADLLMSVIAKRYPHWMMDHRKRVDTAIAAFPPLAMSALSSSTSSTTSSTEQIATSAPVAPSELVRLTLPDALEPNWLVRIWISIIIAHLPHHRDDSLFIEAAMNFERNLAASRRRGGWATGTCLCSLLTQNELLFIFGLR